MKLVDLNSAVSSGWVTPNRHMRGYRVYNGLTGSDADLRRDAMLFMIVEDLIERFTPPIEQIELYDGLIVIRYPAVTKVYKYEES